MVLSYLLRDVDRFEQNLFVTNLYRYLTRMFVLLDRFENEFLPS